MCKLFYALKTMGRDRKGATAVEYGLILALIVLAVISSIQAVGGVTGDMWNNVSSKVRAVGP